MTLISQKRKSRPKEVKYLSKIIQPISGTGPGALAAASVLILAKLLLSGEHHLTGEYPEMQGIK